MRGSSLLLKMKNLFEMKLYHLELRLTGCHVKEVSWPQEFVETKKTFKLKEGFVLKSRLNKTTFRHQWGSFIASTYSFEEDFSGLKADLINRLTYERDYLTKQIAAVNELK